MIVALRKQIVKYLKSKHPRVYFINKVPKNAKFPYLVYDFQPSFRPDESCERLMIEIDGWDKPSRGSSKVLEELMETINGDGDLSSPTGLDKSILDNEDIMSVFSMESRHFLDEKGTGILRRKYTYSVTVYERSTS